MARLSDRLPDNAPGDFYVDRSCIDCAVCRTVAPASFARSTRSSASIVTRQPTSDAETLRAAMALVACPTSSIGTRSLASTGPGALTGPRPPIDDAIAAFPEPLGDDVYFCGFASESSYGAHSYLVVRPEGNVLIDSPRAVPRLLDAIERLGGVRWMFLTHRDDVADHAKFARRFGATRLLHRADLTSDTHAVEHILDGEQPIRLDHDVLIVPTPGHTPGSAALLFRDLALFTGDHLFATGSSTPGSRLYASPDVCWHSWEAQERSLAALLDLDFRWVLPGHEARLRSESPTAMRGEVTAALARARAHPT